ncbi:MAG TPA: F420-0--gamma-glutamyl ligase [Candidatus Limnocylindria bacterium]|nr:F420-0--gamma-glutamyl ligase [Candidatus Limnocylindria bacterium]
MSTDAGRPEPMTDERPMGVLDAPNEDRALHASLNGVVYARHPVRTHLVTADDDAAEVVRRYVGDIGDDVRLVAVSERMVAITQGRSYPMDTIKAGPLARILVRFVTRPGYGIGLGTPQTMQLAISEVGAPRILLAAALSAVTKPFGVHGLFYRVAGRQAAAIDGPTSYTIPPYNKSATLGPKDPDGAARDLAAAIGAPVAVIDANDAGCAVLGASPGVDRRFVEQLFADNPLGQAREQTPICVVREVAWPAGQELPAEPRRRLTPP